MRSAYGEKTGRKSQKLLMDLTTVTYIAVELQRAQGFRQLPWVETAKCSFVSALWERRKNNITEAVDPRLMRLLCFK